jgi:hypothetical protein
LGFAYRKLEPEEDLEIKKLWKGFNLVVCGYDGPSTRRAKNAIAMLKSSIKVVRSWCHKDTAVPLPGKLILQKVT